MRFRLPVNLFVWIGIAAMVAGGIATKDGAPLVHAAGHDHGLASLAAAPSGASDEDPHKGSCPFCRLVSALVLPEPAGLPRFLRFPRELRHVPVYQSGRHDGHAVRPLGARAPPLA